MKEKIVFINKDEGETPLQSLDKLRKEQSLYKHAVLSYAGRLDPMAEGEILVLVDEENKNREKYLNLDKEYEVEVLFGVGTDTGDILGLVTRKQERVLLKTLRTFQISQAIRFFLRKDRLVGRTPEFSKGQASASEGTTILQKFVGVFNQPYPNYSSKTVNGKPLFVWSREDRLHEIEVPTKEVEIYSIDMLGEYNLNGQDLLKKVKKRIEKVRGDFRQDSILESWNSAMQGRDHEEFFLLKIRVKCSSGTYMRSLAESIGEKLGKQAVAWRIQRTKIHIN